MTRTAARPAPPRKMATAWRVYTHSVRPPDEPYGYVIDGPGLMKYRHALIHPALRLGHWPFAYADRAMENGARRRCYPMIPVECGVATVRLSPDCQFYAWGNEYVTVAPDPQYPTRSQASAAAWIERGRVLPFTVDIDMRDESWAIPDLPADVPADLTAAAEAKAAKIVVFLAGAIAEREAGKASPVTAHYLEARRWSDRTERIRAWCAERDVPYCALDVLPGGDHYYMIAGVRLSAAGFAAAHMPGLFGGKR